MIFVFRKEKKSSIRKPISLHEKLPRTSASSCAALILFSAFSHAINNASGCTLSTHRCRSCFHANPFVSRSNATRCDVMRYDAIRCATPLVRISLRRKAAGEYKPLAFPTGDATEWLRGRPASRHRQPASNRERRTSDNNNPPPPPSAVLRDIPEVIAGFRGPAMSTVL